MYGKNAPSLEKVLFAAPEIRRRRDDACQPSAKKPRMTKVLGRKKRAPLIPVPDTDDTPVRPTPEILWSETFVFRPFFSFLQAQKTTEGNVGLLLTAIDEPLPELPPADASFC